MGSGAVEAGEELQNGIDQAIACHAERNQRVSKVDLMVRKAA